MPEFLQSIRDAADIRLFEIGGTQVTIASVVTFGIIVVVTFWVSWLVPRVVTRAMLRAGLQDPGSRAMVRRLINYLMLLIGFAIGLQTVGISLASVFAAGAVVAVGVGFALQNILQNFVSGVILLAERTIKEHDVLEVDGSVVRVEKIGARSTVARTRDDEEVIIPNTILVQSTVKNYTLSDTAYRIRTTVGVAYSSDMREVERVLDEVSRTIPGRLEDQDPRVMLLEFGDSAVIWETSIWVENPFRAPGMRSQLNQAIWWGLKDAGIVIAFPQLDVHVQPQPKGD